ncbi:MAG TPA: protein arginine kinase [Bacillota bacterium]|nr:protein arginine kinase [Bacillota bacterium]
MSWIDEKGPDNDIVLSSRIRLARNISDLSFPSIMKGSLAQDIMDLVKGSLQGTESDTDRKYRFIAIKDLAAADRQVLVERHLASRELMKLADISALMVDEKQEVTVMINEEDHIRLQCILPGFQLSQAWDLLDAIDDLIEDKVDYSFDDRLGYLTTCPTNVGTGLRASVMMHLPALAATKQISAVLRTISKIGLTARGLYGEGSEALGNIYQISNQITLGPSEDEIINNLTVASQRIFEKERQAQRALLKVSGSQFEDVLWRAIGTLLYARVMDLKEFMSLLSQIRLGAGLGLFPQITAENINELMILGQPGALKKRVGRALVQEEQSSIRAKAVRSRLDELMFSVNKANEKERGHKEDQMQDSEEQKDQE